MSGSLAGSVTRPRQQQPRHATAAQGEGAGLCFSYLFQACSLSLGHWESPLGTRLQTLTAPLQGGHVGRGAKAPDWRCEVAGVIRISDDSSTESDGGLTVTPTSPESLLDDDVVIVDAIGLPADDRGEAQCRPPHPVSQALSRKSGT